MLRPSYSVMLAAAKEQTSPSKARPPLVSAQTWAAMPAMVALAAAVGAGATALTHAVALPDFTGQFWLAAVAGLVFCAASHWDGTALQNPAWNAGRAVRRVLGAALALGLFALPPLCAWLKLLNGQWFVPLDVLMDGNLLVAVFHGLDYDSQRICRECRAAAGFVHRNSFGTRKRRRSWQRPGFYSLAAAHRAAAAGAFTFRRAQRSVG
jgi:hypothetical protein